MQRLSVILIAAVSSVALVQIASAADLPAKAPVYKTPVAVAPSWTGFYIGANVGGGWGNQSVNYAANDLTAAFLFFLGAPPPASFTTSGALAGLQLGYNWQFAGNWLAGLEADFDWSGIKGSGLSGGAGVIAPFTSTVEEKLNWLGTVRARLGYLPADNLLAFVTGGFAYGRVEYTGNYNVGAPTFNSGVVLGSPYTFSCAANATCFSGSSGTTATGWTVGGGLEYALAQSWTVKAEYMYVSLGAKSVTETALAVLGSTPPASFNANFGRTNLNIARVGLNYRF